MPAVIVLILGWFTKYLIFKALFYIGVGIGSYAIVQFFFDKYINAGLAQIGGLPADLSYLIGIAHIDHAISIVIGAMSIRAFIVSMRTLLAKM